ncbi:MAG: ATP-binding protein [Oscillatoriales cyanobacterium SM2_1_8]|nr:ATP-binding protein [Oscillatoriales cyanobacterium SM2_1_8]
MRRRERGKYGCDRSGSGRSGWPKLGGGPPGNFHQAGESGLPIAKSDGSPRWQMYRFPSTLYLHGVLNDLVGAVPLPWQGEVRLGLQEALVNAVKHGNGLDDQKWVTVRSRHEVRPDGHHSWWAIADEGVSASKSAHLTQIAAMGTRLCPEDAEGGRGWFILQQLFQRVHWDGERHQLSLYKNMGPHTPPLLA